MSWMAGGELSCVHCMGVRTVFLRFDKRGHPYLFCGACGSRSFVGLASALSGCAILSPVVEEFAERAAADPEFALSLQSRRDAFLKELQERMRPQAPAAQPSQVQQAAGDEKERKAS